MAGSGGPKKQLSLINGIPTLLYSLRLFQDMAEIDTIAVAVSPDIIPDVHSLIAYNELKKVHRLVQGGPHRQDSVKFSARAVQEHEPVDIFLVHDAVRPFITRELVRRVIDGAVERGAAIAAVPCKDTIKEVHDGVVTSTLNRENLWSVQTPQAFDAELLLRAFLVAEQEGNIATDEAALVERLKHPVYIVEGSPDNLKITTPGDLAVSEYLAERFKPGLTL
jgi:2-C-methyl-D-erythritol 4-phosphate cytidylyltransferase